RIFFSGRTRYGAAIDDPPEVDGGLGHVAVNASPVAPNAPPSPTSVDADVHGLAVFGNVLFAAAPDGLFQCDLTGPCTSLTKIADTVTAVDVAADAQGVCYAGESMKGMGIHCGAGIAIPPTLVYNVVAPSKVLVDGP